MVKRFPAAVLAVLLLVSACAARTRTPRAFIPVTDAFTASTFTEGIRLTPRLELAELDRACENVRRIARLETTTGHLELLVGERFFTERPQRRGGR